MPFQSRCIRKLAGSPDHLVGLKEERRGNREAKRVGGLEVDDQLKFRRLLHRQVARLVTLENAIDIAISAN